MLARDLGMSVAEAQAKISSAEFTDWVALRRIRHMPEDINTARICWTVARFAGGAKDAKVEDFLPDLKPRPKRMTGAQMKAVVMGMAKRQQERIQSHKLKREKARNGN